MITVTCHHCGGKSRKPMGAFNRAKKAGAGMYCNKTCAGLARRKAKSKAQKAQAKRLYDMVRRTEKRDELAEKKRQYYQENRDRLNAEMTAKRKARMPQHLEYCRRPEYRATKCDYDKRRRASEYGPFAETYLLLIDVEKEIRSQATHYERRVMNGYYTRNAQMRRRELCQSKARNSTPAI